MARINLLPWRQEERARKNKEFNVMAGAASALAVLAVLIAMTFLNRELSNQQAANDKIKNENARLDGIMTQIADLERQRDDMLARMKVIQDLQGHRSIPVRVWDDIARAIPSASYLVSMRREDNTITLNGYAADNNVIAELIRNLDASRWLANSGVPNIRTSVEAYAVPTPPRQNGNQPTRAVLPEDSYISFTVTTQVVTEGLTAEGVTDPNANLAVGQPANAPSDQQNQTNTQPAGGQ